jgi:uncharacterized membrane protein
MPVSRRRKPGKIKPPKPTAASMNERRELKVHKDHQKGTQQITGKYYQGIIPSPEMMKEYQEIDPNLPMRLVQMTEDEALHRREMEKSIVVNGYKTARNNMLAGFFALVALCILSFLFMINDHPVEGGVIAGSISVVIGLFVFRRITTNGKEEIKEK